MQQYAATTIEELYKKTGTTSASGKFTSLIEVLGALGWKAMKDISLVKFLPESHGIFVTRAMSPSFEDAPAALQDKKNANHYAMDIPPIIHIVHHKMLEKTMDIASKDSMMQVAMVYMPPLLAAGKTTTLAEML